MIRIVSPDKNKQLRCPRQFPVIQPKPRKHQLYLSFSKNYKVRKGVTGLRWWREWESFAGRFNVFKSSKIYSSSTRLLWKAGGKSVRRFVASIKKTCHQKKQNCSISLLKKRGSIAQKSCPQPHLGRCQLFHHQKHGCLYCQTQEISCWWFVCKNYYATWSRL